MMMFCVHFCAYYFAVDIRYFGYWNKISWSFHESNPLLRLLYSNTSVGCLDEIFVD